MKQRNSFLMRCLAFALALVLLVSGSGLSAALQVFAVTEENGKATVTYAELVANNYELTDAEKNLLNSGLLASGSFTYSTGLTEELVTIDNENAKITANSYEGWTPVSATLEVNGVPVQTVTLTDGEGTYDPSVGNAFAVKVHYVLNTTVSADVQNTLLNTAGWLKQGVANTDTVSEQGGTLYILEEAMPTLVDYINNGIDYGLAVYDNFSPESQAAVNALNAQMTANGGKLDLSVMIDEYDASAKTGYLLTKGAAMRAKVEETVNYVSTIKSELESLKSSLEATLNLGFITEDQKTQINSAISELSRLINILGNQKTALETAAAGQWTAANKGTALVAENVDYAKLDTLVAALGETTSVTVAETLKVAETFVQKNMSMFYVTVVVALNVVENAVGSDKLVEYGSKTVTLTLGENATAEEIQAAIDESNVVADAKAAWGAAYVAEHYVLTASELPGTLTKDTTVTYTYAPKHYTVTYEYDGTTASLPYGYQLSLPRHSDASKAYDYTVNGVYYAQGAVHVVTGDVTITRKVGDAYTATDLFTVVSNNYKNDVVTAVLGSNALKAGLNTTIAYRQPNSSKLTLSLEDGVLTAQASYASDFAGYNWVPYTYGKDGTENLFSGNTASWSESSANVQYILRMTNHTDEAQEILDLVATLLSESSAQISTLAALTADGVYGNMGELNKTKLGALNGVIDVTDFSDDPAKNVELRAYFKEVVSSIIANNLDGANLKIYNLLTEYKDKGLLYYYQHSEEFISEINSLSNYLNKLLDEEEALKIMVVAAGYPDVANMIVDLESTLNSVKASLSTPDAAIDLESSALGTLTKALEDAHKNGVTLKNPVAAAPYVTSPSILVKSDDEAALTIKVEGCGPEGSFSTDTHKKVDAYKLTQADINALVAKINAYAAENLGTNVKYYTVSYADADGNAISLNDLVGKALTSDIEVTCTYAPTEYTVNIVEGDKVVSTQTVTVKNLNIILPANGQAGYSYKYTVGEKTVTVGETNGSYTFDASDLDTLFKNGVCTVTRVLIDNKSQGIEDFVAALNEAVRSKNAFVLTGTHGAYTGVTANISAEQLMDAVMGMTNGGYSYVGLNGQGLLYLNDESSLEVSIQTLINALLNDSTFTNQTLIDLGNNGKGKLLTTTLQLGDSEYKLDYTNLNFTINLTNVPDQMKTVANGLNAVKDYMTFKAGNGTMTVKLNLPEKVYEVYLTALLATGTVDKSDMNAVNQAIAFQFLYDYVELIMNNDDVTTTTFTNTLKKLGQGYDLTGAEEYYQLLKNFMDRKETVLTIDNTGMGLDITIGGQGAINKLMSLMGTDPSSKSTYLNMIAEYKGGNIYGSTKAVLVNVPTEYEALVLDLNASGVQNKFDYTANLTKRVTSIAGSAAIILLDDVTGNMTFNGTTILDLNGKTINGNIVANGTLIIVDSSIDTANCGWVKGNVSGNVTVVGGNYTADVSAYLRDGYVQNGTAVSNVLYTVEEDEAGNITFVLNTNFENLPDVKSLGLDVALDLVLNYFTSAALSVDGNCIYDVDLNDLVGLLTSNNKVDDVITKVLQSIDVEGMAAVANTIIADLLDFEAIEAAAAGDGIVASYTLTTAPWAVEVEHITNGNYLTAGVGSNNKLAKTYTVTLKLDGKYNAKVEELAGALAEIVDVAEVKVNAKQPTYNGSTNTIDLIGGVDIDIQINLTANKNYQTILAVVLANGGSAQKDALVNAVNNCDEAALKAAFDKVTVAEVVDALEKLNRNETFAALAKKVGVTLDVTDAAALESIYHVYLTAVGKAIELAESQAEGIADLTDSGRVLGYWDGDNDGKYVLVNKEDISRDGTLSARGYNANYELSIGKLYVSVNIFTETNPDVPQPVVPTPVTVTIDGCKMLKGPEGATRTLTEGEFQFVIKDENGNELATVSHNQYGIFGFIKEFNTVGTYVYTISEVKGSDTTVTYDETVYTVTVEITLNEENNELEAIVTVRNGEEIADEIVFVNTYTVSDGPQTGDETDLTLLVSLMVVSLVAFAGLVIFGNVKKNRSAR